MNMYFRFKEDKKGLFDHCTPDYLLGGIGRFSNNSPFVGLYGERNGLVAKYQGQENMILSSEFNQSLKSSFKIVTALSVIN